MVQGYMVKISYKSDKCLRQPRENWIIVENTHEPIIDKETLCYATGDFRSSSTADKKRSMISSSIRN